MNEIEVKLQIDDADAMRGQLGASGAVASTPRSFEDNQLYDDADGTLKSSDRLLRLRTVGSRHLLTFKGKSEDSDDSRYKIRTEHETHIEDADNMAQVLEGLGYRPAYRYQKFRQIYEIGGVHAALDETPMGAYLELEGEPADIDAVAQRLGFGVDDYITDTYYALHQQHAGEDDPGDLVFESS